METLDIPQVEVAIGADYLFKASQLFDLLGTVDFSALAGTAFSVEIYNAAFPGGTLDSTLTGSKVSGSNVDYYAIWTDTATAALSNGDDYWAKLIFTAGNDAKAVKFIKIIARGA